MKHLALIISLFTLANIAPSSAEAQSVGVACLTVIPCDDNGNLLDDSYLDLTNPCFNTYFNAYMNFCAPKQTQNAQASCKSTSNKVKDLEKKLKKAKRQLALARRSTK